MYSRRKVFITVILAAVCVLIFTIGTLIANRLIFAEKVRNRDAKKLEAIDRMMNDLSSSLTEAEQKAVNQYEVSAVLTAKALESVISDAKDDSLAAYRNGAVVRIGNNLVSAPGDTVQRLGLSAASFNGQKGVFPAPADPSTLIAYSRISQTPYYYLEWYEDTVLEDLVRKTVNLEGILEEAETAYGSRIVLVQKDADSEAAMTVLYSSEDFSPLKETGEIGLTLDELAQSVGQPPKNLELNDVTYMYSVGEIPSLNGYAILLVPESDIVRQSIDQVVGLVSLLILILAGMITAGLSLYDYALENEHHKRKDTRYEPAFVRKAVALFGVTGLLIMGISSAYIYSLNGLLEATKNGRDALDMLEKRIVMNISRDSYGIRSSVDSFIHYGNHISDLLDQYPQLQDAASLEEFSKCIGATSITLYDHNGREIVSSNGYIDLSLGTDAGSSTYDFRRILKGVPYIVHEMEKDETTGLTEMRVGIRITDAAEPGKYGVMLISINPSVFQQVATEEIGSTLRYMSDEETRLWIAEKENGTILAASDSELIGRDIYSIGLGENDLKDGLMKSVFLENGQYFVVSSLLDDPVIEEDAERLSHSATYYAVNRTATNYGVLYTVVNCCVMYAIIYVFLAWFVYRGYTEAFYRECQSKTLAISSKVYKRPEQRAFTVIKILIAAFLLMQFPLLSLKKSGHSSLLYYILAGNWERGLNLFAISRVMILAGEMMLGIILLNFALRIIGRQAGTKGETICRLILSVVRYVAIASFVGLALYYLGMDKTTLLAAISILSLAVSLGSQSLVADIIAGISLILEGEFDVGDDVVIGSHKGKVLEIGVRSTRILCEGNDVMVISNKEINTIINKSKLNTVFKIAINIHSDHPVDEIREMLDRELPSISAMDDRILRGPVYEGITKIGNRSMTLSIATECRQSDYKKVMQFVNGELVKLFARNGIRV